MISTALHSETLAAFRQDKHSVALLHDAPALMAERQFHESLVVIASVFVIICIIQGLLVTLLQSHLAAEGSREPHKANVHKISYQGTNFVVNLFLGLYGIHSFATLPAMTATPLVSRISEFDHLAQFALLQIGYNLWSIPVGLFLIHESKLMMVHHISTIAVSSICAFCTNGQRYHAPFFFGVIEISSVPLSLLNFSRDNPSWVKNYPLIQHGSRPIFAVFFLLTRVLLWTPCIRDVLRNSILIAWTCPTTSCQLVSVTFTVSAVFLTALQWYWGFFVTRGLLKLIHPNKS